jgi:MTH538 TIR-like domain (DUF1863)
MSEATQAVEPPASGQAKPQDYDAFLSYTHRDRLVVSGIQKGLHHVGRRLGQLRALRVFRDDTDLTASPDLWGRITEALDRSRFLIATLSPQAAASHWVNKEISYWLEHRGREQLMLVVAAGQVNWDEPTARFDPQASDAAPPVLTEPGSLPAEPLFIDVSDDSPWDYRAPTFRDKITALAAPIHGKPKDQLASDDLREQRRFRRLRAAAITGLAVLTVVAVIAAVIAVVQRQEAIRQRDQAIAQRLTTEANDMLTGSNLGGDARVSAVAHRSKAGRQTGHRRAASRRSDTGDDGQDRQDRRPCLRSCVQRGQARDRGRGQHGPVVERRNRPTHRRTAHRAHRRRRERRVEPRWASPGNRRLGQHGADMECRYRPTLYAAPCLPSRHREQRGIQPRRAPAGKRR